MNAMGPSKLLKDRQLSSFARDPAASYIMIQDLGSGIGMLKFSMQTTVLRVTSSPFSFSMSADVVGCRGRRQCSRYLKQVRFFVRI